MKTYYVLFIECHRCNKCYNTLRGKKIHYAMVHKKSNKPAKQIKYRMNYVKLYLHCKNLLCFVHRMSCSSL